MLLSFSIRSCALHGIIIIFNSLIKMVGILTWFIVVVDFDGYRRESTHGVLTISIKSDTGHALTRDLVKV